jgi:UDP-glucose 4-epimerase
MDSESNLMGTLKLLSGLRALRVRPRLLFASSGGAVYGRPLRIPLDESHPTLPLGAYGVTKLSLEHHLRVEEILSGLPYRVLRLSNPFGEWQRPQGIQGVIAVFAYRALHDRAVEVWGDGSVVRDFIYAGDVGSAFAAAAVHQGEARTFNVGGGVGLSVNEVLRTLERLLGRRIQRRTMPGRVFDPPTNVLDISLAGREMGWAPMTSFEDGLSRSIEWLRSEQ